MIAVVGDNNGLTNFTRLLLEATGWYKINPSYSHNNNWAKNSGCNFIFNNCVKFK